MFKTPVIKYIFSGIITLVGLGIFWILISGVVPSMQVIFPVFMAPVLLGALLGIILPIISSRSQENEGKQNESKQSKNH